MKNLIPFLILSLTLLSCGSKSDLKLDLTVGETYYQEMEVNMNMVQTAMGQKMDIVMNIKGKLSFLVLSKEAGNFELKVRYNELSMFMDMPQGSMTYNSKKKDQDDIFSQVMAAITQESFQMTLNTKGEVIKVNGMNEIWDKAIAQFDFIPESAKEQIKAQLKDSYGENSLKDNMEMATAIFPNMPVAIGDTWKKVIQTNGKRATTIHMEYELVGMDAEYYEIEGKGDMKSAMDYEPLAENGIKTTVSLDGATVTHLKINRKTGWIMDSDATQEISGTSTVSMQDNEMTIPFEAKTIYKIKG